MVFKYRYIHLPMVFFLFYYVITDNMFRRIKSW